MERYNLRELRENLSSHIQGLGSSSKFLDNPSYDAFLDTIQSLIRQMNLFEMEDSVLVGEEKGKIEFYYLSCGNVFSMSISFVDSNTFQAVRVINKCPYVSGRGKMVRNVEVVEMVAGISDSGFMSLTQNYAMLYNTDCVGGKCNNMTSSKHSIYDDKGVMVGVEYKGYPTRELAESILDEPTNDFSIDSALYVPRNAYGICHNQYSTRTFLKREYLDTARIIHEDRDKKFYYNAVTRLNSEHGLRDMTMVGGYDPYPEKVEILPLSAEQIEGLIQLEDNLKVQEGLRAFVRDREHYSYDSSTDPSFVCTSGQDVFVKRRK